jgi:TM2 domain-containing membrane protein YozV
MSIQLRSPDRLPVPSISMGEPLPFDCPKCGVRQVGAMPGISDKRILPVFLLCLFFGGLGVHRFYVGKIGTGIAIILTFFGFCGIWPLIDLILILTSNFTDSKGNKITLWT